MSLSFFLDGCCHDYHPTNTPKFGGAPRFAWKKWQEYSLTSFLRFRLVRKLSKFLPNLSLLKGGSGWFLDNVFHKSISIGGAAVAVPTLFDVSPCCWVGNPGFHFACHVFFSSFFFDHVSQMRSTWIVGYSHQQSGLGLAPDTFLSGWGWDHLLVLIQVLQIWCLTRLWGA